MTSYRKRLGSSSCFNPKCLPEAFPIKASDKPSNRWLPDRRLTGNSRGNMPVSCWPTIRDLRSARLRRTPRPFRSNVSGSQDVVSIGMSCRRVEADFHSEQRFPKASFLRGRKSYQTLATGLRHLSRAVSLPNGAYWATVWAHSVRSNAIAATTLNRQFFFSFSLPNSPPNALLAGVFCSASHLSQFQ